MGSEQIFCKGGTRSEGIGGFSGASGTAVTVDATDLSGNDGGVFDECVGLNNNFLVDKAVENESTEHSCCGLGKALDVSFVSSFGKGNSVVFIGEFKGGIVLLDIGIAPSPYFLAISDWIGSVCWLSV